MIQDVIHIKDLKLWAHVGVLEEERLTGQYFVLDISIWKDLNNASRLDDVNYSADYTLAILRIQKVSSSINCLTMERYTDLIMDNLEELYGSVPIRIYLRKLTPPISGFAGTVGLERYRNHK